MEYILELSNIVSAHSIKQSTLEYRWMSPVPQGHSQSKIHLHLNYSEAEPKHTSVQLTVCTIAYSVFNYSRD